ncbi:MAG TPA: hypothetical protein VMB66_04170 [Candidatus Acidoferrales bacterium]|nr:hypothetical protein [Candidatus Acidoferrales bacterium]
MRKIGADKALAYAGTLGERTLGKPMGVAVEFSLCLYLHPRLVESESMANWRLSDSANSL